VSSKKQKLRRGDFRQREKDWEREKEKNMNA
jgi:hypothetical protein